MHDKKALMYWLENNNNSPSLSRISTQNKETRQPSANQGASAKRTSSLTPYQALVSSLKNALVTTVTGSTRKEMSCRRNAEHGEIFPPQIFIRKSINNYISNLKWMQEWVVEMLEQNLHRHLQHLGRISFQDLRWTPFWLPRTLLLRPGPV